MTNHPTLDKLPAFDRRMLLSLYTFFSLKIAFVVAVVGLALIAILYVFSLFINALVELCTSIAQTYTACTSIEKLLALVIALVVFNKFAPVAMRTFRIWKGL
jgi:hypothetical protein